MEHADASESFRVIKFNSPAHNGSLHFPSNHIRTTKYTAFSFPFLGIAYQFLRFSNCYFLLIVILSSIPEISPTSPFTAINPFVFVIAVSLLREGLEDYARYSADKSKFIYNASL